MGNKVERKVHIVKLILTIFSDALAKLDTKKFLPVTVNFVPISTSVKSHLNEVQIPVEKLPALTKPAATG